MTKTELKQLQIKSVSESIYDKIQKNWDNVAKPLNGLGRFEKIIAQIGAVQGTEQVRIDKRGVLVFCGDNGIVEEGVSQSGQDVTGTVTRFMAENKTSVGKMAKAAHTVVLPIDIGVNWEEEPRELLREVEDCESFCNWLDNRTDSFVGIANCRVKAGTRNFRKEYSMKEEEALQAIETGIRMAKWCREAGFHLVATGEMGIGNTTTSAALTAGLLGMSAEQVAGRGAGLDDEGLARKCQVITEALERYGFSENGKNVPVIEITESDTRFEKTFTLLQAVGGLDIAGMVGVCIGGAVYGLPVVLDGVISVVAALVAECLVPGVKRSCIASHVSREKAAAKIMDAMGLQPVIYGDLALGEGTGAVMMFTLLDTAMALYESETSFDAMEIEPYVHMTTSQDRR